MLEKFQVHSVNFEIPIYKNVWITNNSLIKEATWEVQLLGNMF